MFTQPGDELLFEIPPGQQFANELVQVIAQSEMLLVSIKDSLTPVDEFMIAFCFPVTDSLAVLKQSVSDLDKCLAQAVVHPKLEGVVRFVEVESGSSWFLISLGSATACEVIRVVARAASAIAQERLRHGQAELYLKSLGLDVELIESAKEKTATVLKALTAEKATEINSAHYGGDPEQTERLVYVLDVLSDFFVKGARLEPAKLPPVGVDTGFPDTSALLESVRRPKLLE